MSPKGRLIALRLEDSVVDQLEADRERFGTPVSEQVRRAIVAWLSAGGMKAAAGDSGKKTVRKRVTARKRT